TTERGESPERLRGGLLPRQPDPIQRPAVATDSGAAAGPRLAPDATAPRTTGGAASGARLVRPGGWCGVGSAYPGRRQGDGRMGAWLSSPTRCGSPTSDSGTGTVGTSR